MALTERLRNLLRQDDWEFLDSQYAYELGGNMGITSQEGATTNIYEFIKEENTETGEIRVRHERQYTGWKWDDEFSEVYVKWQHEDVPHIRTITPFLEGVDVMSERLRDYVDSHGR